MKVIDLINMMNNKEDLPEKIKINKRVFHSNVFRSMIYEEDCNTDIWMAIKLQHIDLDDVVKIIEENQDIDIQSINELLMDQLTEREHNDADIIMLGKQINVLTIAIKQLDRQINNN